MTVSAADPLNLTGTVHLGDRVPAAASTRVAFRDGVPVATQSANRRAEFLEPLAPEHEWAVRNALLRKRIPVSALSSPLPFRPGEGRTESPLTPRCLPLIAERHARS